MNQSKIPASTTAACSAYEWCEGNHGPEELETSELGPINHSDKRAVEIEFSEGISKKLTSIWATREKLGDRPQALYVSFDDATIDVPYGEVPAYLEKLRQFVDKLETYYRLTNTEQVSA